jgi:hypothetical protein
MFDFVDILFRTVLEALRRLWERLTGRERPAPVPVRVERHESTAWVEGESFSRWALTRSAWSTDGAMRRVRR